MSGSFVSGYLFPLKLSVWFLVSKVTTVTLGNYTTGFCKVTTGNFEEKFFTPPSPLALLRFWGRHHTPVALPLDPRSEGTPPRPRPGSLPLALVWLVPALLDLHETTVQMT